MAVPWWFVVTLMFYFRLSSATDPQWYAGTIPVNLSAIFSVVHDEKQECMHYHVKKPQIHIKCQNKEGVCQSGPQVVCTGQSCSFKICYWVVEQAHFEANELMCREDNGTLATFIDNDELEYFLKYFNPTTGSNGETWLKDHGDVNLGYRQHQTPDMDFTASNTKCDFYILTDRLRPITEESSTTILTSTTTTEQPITTEEQLTTTERPETTEEHPRTTEEHTTEEHPRTTEEQTTTQQSQTTEEYARITEEHDSEKIATATFSKELTTIGKDSTSISKDPTTISEDPTTFTEDPTTTSNDPTTISGESVTITKDSATFREEPSTFSDSSATFREDQGTLNGETTTISEDPETNSEDLDTNNEDLGTFSEESAQFTEDTAEATLFIDQSTALSNKQQLTTATTEQAVDLTTSPFQEDSTQIDSTDLTTRSCCYCYNTTNLTSEPEVILTMQRELKVPTGDLSSTRRKLTSATDNRLSSICIGSASILVLSSSFGFIVWTDIIVIVRTVKRNWRRLKNGSGDAMI